MSKKNTTNKSSIFLKRSLWPIVLSLITLVGIITVIRSAQYQINPDGIAYLSIADHYAHLEIREAINGYWGPLLSLLLAPLIKLGINPLFAFKLLNVTFAVILASLFYWWQKKTFINLSIIYRAVLSASLLILLLGWSIEVITPDILFALILFVEVIILSELGKEGHTWRWSILLGTFAALLYFTKSIGLPIFVIQVIILFLLSKKLAIRRGTLLIAALAFCLISAPYILAISVKYDKPTFSTSSTYNISLLSPAMGRVHTVDRPGILMPRYNNSVTAWEDPTFLPYPRWSPFSSLNEFQHYVGEVRNNTTALGSYLLGLGFAFVLGTTALIAALRQSHFYLFSAGTGLIISVLYGLTLVEQRYLWCLVPLAFAGVAFYFSRSTQNRALESTFNKYIVGAMLVSSVIMSLPVFTAPSDTSTVEEAKSLQRIVGRPGAMVTSDFTDIYLCYYAKIQCAGKFALADFTSRNTQSSNIIHGLKANNIGYYLATRAEVSILNDEGIDKVLTRVGSTKEHVLFRIN